MHGRAIKYELVMYICIYPGPISQVVDNSFKMFIAITFIAKTAVQHMHIYHNIIIYTYSYMSIWPSHTLRQLKHNTITAVIHENIIQQHPPCSCLYIKKDMHMTLTCI